MKYLAICVLALGLFAAANLRGADEPATPADPKALHKHMEAVNKALQKLTRNVKDPKKNDQNLLTVHELQEHTLAAKSLEPTANASTRPADQRPAYVAEYRRQMIEVLKTELDLERQILDNKNEDAAATIKKLREQEKKGHQDYRPPEKE